MVASPLSFPYTFRRKRKESFRIEFGESDTSGSSDNEAVAIDDVFCSVDDDKQVFDKYCATRQHAKLWIIGGAILFVLPIIALPSILKAAHRSDLTGSSAPPLTIEDKADLPQVSLIDKLGEPAPLAPSPVSRPTVAPSSIDHNRTPEAASRSPMGLSLNTGTLWPVLVPLVSNANDGTFTTDESNVSTRPTTPRPSSHSRPTRAPSSGRVDESSSLPTVQDERVSEPPATGAALELPSLSSISIPIGVPISTPVAARTPVVMPKTTLRINCGGDQLMSTTPEGHSRFWIPDRFYTSTGTLWRNSTCDDEDEEHTESSDGTTTLLYCTARENVESYSIPVTNGNYAVSFHLLVSLGVDTPPSLTILGTPVDVTDASRQIVHLKTRVDTAIMHIPISSASSSDEEGGRILLAAIEVLPDLDGGDDTSSTMVQPAVAVVAVEAPTSAPTRASTTTSTLATGASSYVNITYSPGDLVVHQQGLVLSRGLTARAIATSGHRILYRDGTSSNEKFHRLPDAGATFPDTRSDNNNEGGWIYVSNSEVKPTSDETYPGGVGAVTFDREGLMIDYRMVLTDTRMNCGGGRTPWGAWISGEEYADTGHIWQVDPTGERKAERITMGETHPGLFESFAYDVRNRQQPWFFMTQDHKSGALRRFSPDIPTWDDPWHMLLGNGTIEYLVVEPFEEVANAGSFRWTTDFEEGADTAFLHFQNTEGIDVNDHHLYFVSKTFRTIFILDLDTRTYVNETTRNGLFNGQPDQVERIDESRPTNEDELVYFTEDGGRLAGVHARNSQGQYLTVLESSEYSDETTGLSFSPDGKHLYVAYQENGVLFDVTREDGLSFHAGTMDIKFHAAV